MDENKKITRYSKSLLTNHRKKIGKKRKIIDFDRKTRQVKIKFLKRQIHFTHQFVKNNKILKVLSSGPPLKP
jgi:hypothetical protein